MKADSFFEVGKNDIVQLGRNFIGWFSDVPLISTKNPVYYKDLDVYMSTDEIVTKLKPAEMQLGDVARIVGQKTDLIRDRFNVFFVKDAGDLLRVIDVYWSELGWCVCSRALEETKRCVVGRVFSSTPLK